MEFLMEFLSAFQDIMLEGSFYILFGFLIAGVLHVFIPVSKINRFIGQSEIGGIFKGILIGTPLPICSCGILPAALSLQDKGVKKPAIASFLISTPSTGVDSILTSYAFLGLPLTIAKLALAVITSFLTGISVHWFDKSPQKVALQSDEKDSQCHGKCGCNGEDCELKTEHGKSCECGFEPDIKHGPIRSLLHVLRYSTLDMLPDISLNLLVGLMLAALIGVLVNSVLPKELIETFAQNPILSLLIMLVMSLPVYVCATSSVPLAAGFLFAGFTPGSVLVFLMAGPATNTATMSIVGKRFGKRFLAIYLTTIILTSLVFGYLVNLFWEGVSPFNLLGKGLDFSAEETHSWIEYLAAIILSALILFGIYREKIKPLFAKKELNS